MHSSRDLELSQLFCKCVEDQRHAITWLNLHRPGYWPLVGESKRSKMHCFLFYRLCTAPEVVDVCSNGLDCRRYHLAERLVLAAKPSAAEIGVARGSQQLRVPSKNAVACVQQTLNLPLTI